MRTWSWARYASELAIRLELRTRSVRRTHSVATRNQGKRSYLIASTFADDPYREEAPVLRRLSEQFEYFPQLAEERYPAFLAIPLLSGSRPRGALVLQREAGPFSESDLLLAIGATRALSALVDAPIDHGGRALASGTMVESVCGGR